MKRFNQLRWHLFVIALAVVCSIPCCAAEVAVLRNGFSIRHERREVIGSDTRLFLNSDGSSYVDVPTEVIEHFETSEEPASGSRLPAGSQTANCGSDPASPKPDCGSPKPSLDDVVNSASSRYRLDPDLVTSVIKAESGFNVRAVSPKGALGLMQLMPGTASKLGVPNAFDPEANVEGGTKYLRELLERYDFDLVKALAAYNAGPRRVEQYGGVPPYYETRAYVARIVRDFNKKKVAAKKAVAQKASAKKTGIATTKASEARTESLAQAR